jgi:hypothetical protein
MVEEREKMREYDGIYTFSFLSFNLVGDWVMLFSGSTGIQDSDALNRITLKSNMGYMDKYPAISPNTPLPGQYCR